MHSTSTLCSIYVHVYSKVQYPTKADFNVMNKLINYSWIRWLMALILAMIMHNYPPPLHVVRFQWFKVV